MADPDPDGTQNATLEPAAAPISPPEAEEGVNLPLLSVLLVILALVTVSNVWPGSMTGGFLRREELLSLHRTERDSFEGWSALLLDRLDEVLATLRQIRPAADQVV